ncbi:exo84 subunit/exocyst complex component [Lyophyllum atratum]|nr:exo84 subunit/exocyst complex component [Lyophyllum atratum]
MPESSLRTPRRAPTRKATIAPPLPVGQPIPRGAPKSRVDDRIKKRMSMRYAEMVASPTDMSALPPMPGFPSGSEGMMSLAAGMGMIGDGTNLKSPGGKPLDDKRILESEAFDPDSFLKLKLANSTEAELRSLQSSLRGTKEETNSELQRNVFKNYAEFVTISKEITSLETEMLELKDLLSEYKSMPSVLHIPDPTNQSSNPNVLSTYKRSSVADLRIMYFNQMQELHAHIEGAAKFAPTTPGRHVVAEVEGVLSLNAATYKVVGRVRFVVLDDLVLVARRRRRKAAGEASGSGGGTVNEGKLVAERCWPLSEMLVLDTKDSPRMTNVFKIRHGKETHVYRTENPQDKKSLLAQFRHVAEELAAKKRKEREGEHERRKSMWQGGPSGGGDRSSYIAAPDWMADFASRGGELPGVEVEAGAKEKAERDARWVGEWADDLTVAIALREWDKAVTLVEEGKAKLSIMPLLAHKLPPLNSLLTKSLLDSLSLPSVRKSTVVSLISYLLRLKAGPAARSTFLQMRTKVLKAHVRKIRFEGHVGAYVGDLAVVYFTGIKHTADWFLASFKENEVASAFIEWAKTQIEDFGENFRKQVFTSDVDRQVVEDALKITYTQSKKLLQEYGLDFRYLLDGLLVEKPKEPMKPIPQFTFDDHQMPKIEAVPASRRRTPAPPSNPTTPNPPTLQVDNLAPPGSAIRSALSPAGNSPLLSAASGYTTNSSYSNATAALYNTPNASAVSASFNLPGSTRAPPASATLPRSRTPVSPAPPRARTPASAAPPRSRTPVSAAPPRSAALRPPASPHPPLSGSATGQDVPMASPVPRRARDRDRERDEEWTSDRERPPRSSRSSPVPPPRSSNRPGSSAGQAPRSPLVAIPQREGMI